MLTLHQKLSACRSFTPPADLLGWQGLDEIRHAQFAQKVAHWKQVFLQIKQHKIALYLSDSLEFSAALLGAWHAHKTVYLTADVLANNCHHLAREVDVFIGEFPADFATPLPTSTPRSASNNATAEHYFPKLDADFPALVVYTSGSTGEAQAIPKKWAQLASEIATLESLFGATLADACIYSTVSHHHIYGLLFKVLWPLASGRALFAQALNFPEQLQQHLSLRPCALIASPAHLKRLPDHLDWSGVQAQMRAVFSSGGPLSNEALAHVQTLWQHTPIEVYGSSETGGIAWRQRQQSPQLAWQIFPGLNWRTNVEEGLLEIQSPHLADTAWFQLADRVEALDARHFHLLGRQDRIVKIEEKRISLDLIEKALCASGLVQDARLLFTDVAINTNHEQAHPPQNLGQRQQMMAFVVLTDEGQAYLQTQGKFALNQTLRAKLRQHVETVALPRRWRYLAALPVNAQGKTTQALLLASLSTEALDAAPCTQPRWRVLEQSAERVLLEIIVPRNLLYFQGHFPIAPVLPGVVQVDWARQFGRQHFALPEHFSGIQALKFQQIIAPETPVQLELLHQVSKQALQFRYFSEVGQHATGRILFTSTELHQPNKIIESK